MIGQFTSRFVSGLKTWQVLLALLIFPSIPIAIWFSVLYQFHLNVIEPSLLINLTMLVVGIIFVINSLDSLIRLYTDNLNLTPERLGKSRYLIGNITVLSLLVALFTVDWLKIQWVGALVIMMYAACIAYIVLKKRRDVWSIHSSPKENTLDFDKINRIH